jgi:cytochrome c
MNRIALIAAVGWRAAVLILLFSLPAFGQAEDIPFTFTRVVDTNTPIPGQEGIYARIGGMLTKVLDLTDSLDGKTLAHLFLGYQAVSGNQIVFTANFSDGSQGIYVAQSTDSPPERLVVHDVQASSELTFSLEASDAADGDPLTRWSSEFSDAQFIQVDLGQDTAFDRIVLHWELARAAEYEIQVSSDGETWSTLRRVAASGDVDDLSDLVGSARYVRMQGVTRATPWGYSLFEFEVYRAGINLAAGRPMMASSTERMVFPAAFAVDGDPSTRWNSQFADEQWLAVDLGSTAALDRVVLKWDAGFAADYELLVSDDASSWRTIRNVTDADGGVDELTDLTAGGRYVGLLLHRRGTPWGFALWEFEAYGSPSGIAQ